MTERDLEIITNQSPYPILVEWNNITMSINVIGFKRFEEETREYIDEYRPAWVLAQYELIDSKICDLSRDNLIEYKKGK